MTKITNRIIRNAVATLSLLIIFGIHLISDRYCTIEIQNEGPTNLIFKTIKFTGREWATIKDSVSLKPNEKYKIGHCINSTTLNDAHINFNAIVFFDRDHKPKYLNRKDLIECLARLQKTTCATFIISSEEIFEAKLECVRRNNVRDL